MNPSTRRQLLQRSSTLAAGLALGCATGRPPKPNARQVEDFVARTLEGLDGARMLDSHVHLFGIGSGGTGCWVNEGMKTPLHPVRFSQLLAYGATSGMQSVSHADQDYLARLTSLARMHGMKGRLLVMAFCHFHNEDGSINKERSQFFTPNDYVLRVASQAPDLFVPCLSVHPYAPDALEALEQGRAGGAVAVKWLPNAHGMDPASAKCDAFYQRMAALGLVLITHGGQEQAVHSPDTQDLGNPLRLRRALAAGVKVVVAHCASLGEGEDLDAPEKSRKQVPNFELFLRLMGEKAHEGQLFGDISANTQINRVEPVVRTLLRREDLHARLIQGSDYPLPAIDVLVQPRRLTTLGYITQEEEVHLTMLQDMNPILFDLCAKRVVALREDGKTHRFPASVFMPPAGLFPGINAA